MSAENFALAQIPGEKADLDRLMAGLFPLLEQKARVFTAGDSCSMKIERAESLFESICFVVSYYLKSLPPDEAARALKSQSACTILRDGEDFIGARVDYAHSLWEKIRATKIHTVNIAYNETIEGFGGFFKAYRPDLFAQEIPCDIDYPLFEQMVDTISQGIEYVLIYLGRLQIENDFLNRFDPERLEGPLSGACPDIENFLLNLYEPVANCALGCEMTGTNPYALSMGRCAAGALRERLRGLEGAEIGAMTARAAEALAKRLSLAPREARYLGGLSKTLGQRLFMLAPSGDFGPIFGNSHQGNLIFGRR